MLFWAILLGPKNALGGWEFLLHPHLNLSSLTGGGLRNCKVLILGGRLEECRVLILVLDKRLDKCRVLVLVLDERLVRCRALRTEFRPFICHLGIKWLIFATASLINSILRAINVNGSSKAHQRRVLANRNTAWLDRGNNLGSLRSANDGLGLGIISGGTLGIGLSLLNPYKTGLLALFQGDLITIRQGRVFFDTFQEFITVFAIQNTLQFCCLFWHIWPQKWDNKVTEKRYAFIQAPHGRIVRSSFGLFSQSKCF